MSAANTEVFRGATFHFDIGLSKVRFTVHQVSVTRKSEVLAAMMKNGMKESQEGCAPLLNTEESTFARFVEFIYTGDYNPAEAVLPSPTSERLESDGGHGMEDAPKNEHDIVVPAIEYSPEYFPPDMETAGPAKLHDLTFNATVRSPLPTTSQFVADGHWSRDYLPLFMSHAQLYVFADTYGIEDLKALTAARLHNALSKFRYSSGSATDVAELVRYVFEHTPDRSEDQPDMLRSIVTHFSANNIEALQYSSNFQTLMGKGGWFIQALVRRMCERFGAA